MCAQQMTSLWQNVLYGGGGGADGGSVRLALFSVVASWTSSMLHQQCTHLPLPRLLLPPLVIAFKRLLNLPDFR